MKNLVTLTVVWMIVPMMLLGMMYLAHSMIYRAAEGEHRLSIKSGHWAGIIAFFGYAIYAFDTARIQSFSLSQNVSFEPITFVVAGICGFLLIYVVKTFIPTRMGGLVVMGFVFQGSSMLFSYFFVGKYNPIIFSWTLGTVFGFLLHAVVFPRSIYEIFPERYEDPFGGGYEDFSIALENEEPEALAEEELYEEDFYDEEEPLEEPLEELVLSEEDLAEDEPQLPDYLTSFLVEENSEESNVHYINGETPSNGATAAEPGEMPSRYRKKKKFSNKNA